MSTTTLSSSVNSDSETDTHTFEDNKVRICLTGFGPFGSYSINPSFLIAESLDNLVIPVEGYGEKRRYLVVETFPEPIPVEYEAVDSHVENIWKTYSNCDYIIHLGVGSVGDVRFETRARKYPYSNPDAAGKVLKNGRFHKVFNTCPYELSTSIHVSSVCSKVEHLQQSHCAGLFLCEYIYYSSLSHRLVEISKRKGEIKNQRKLPEVGFIHVPPIGCPWSFQEIKSCVLDCLTEIVRDTTVKDDHNALSTY